MRCGDGLDAGHRLAIATRLAAEGCNVMLTDSASSRRSRWHWRPQRRTSSATRSASAPRRRGDILGAAISIDGGWSAT